MAARLFCFLKDLKNEYKMNKKYYLLTIIAIHLFCAQYTFAEEVPISIDASDWQPKNVNGKHWNETENEVNTLRINGTGYTVYYAPPAISNSKKLPIVKRYLSCKIRFSDIINGIATRGDFQIILKVSKLINNVPIGKYDLRYIPGELPYYFYNSGNIFYFSIGKKYKDGNWHILNRDLREDLVYALKYIDPEDNSNNDNFDIKIDGILVAISKVSEDGEFLAVKDFSFSDNNDIQSNYVIDIIRPQVTEDAGGYLIGDIDSRLAADIHGKVSLNGRPLKGKVIINGFHVPTDYNGGFALDGLPLEDKDNKRNLICVTAEDDQNPGSFTQRNILIGKSGDIPSPISLPIKIVKTTNGDDRATGETKYIWDDEIKKYALNTVISSGNFRDYETFISPGSKIKNLPQGAYDCLGFKYKVDRSDAMLINIKVLIDDSKWTISYQPWSQGHTIDTQRNYIKYNFGPLDTNNTLNPIYFNIQETINVALGPEHILKEIIGISFQGKYLRLTDACLGPVTAFNDAQADVITGSYEIKSEYYPVITESLPPDSQDLIIDEGEEINISIINQEIPQYFCWHKSLKEDLAQTIFNNNPVFNPDNADSENTYTYMPSHYDNGNHRIIGTVENKYGLSDSRYWNITVENASGPPIFDPATVGDRIVYAGEELAFTLSATDPDGDVLTYSADNLPSGASLDPNTGIFKWAPAREQVGSHIITFRVTDGRDGEDIEDIEVIVKRLNNPPIADSKAVNTNEDTPINILLTASDIDGDSLTYEIVGYPNLGDLEITDQGWKYIPYHDYNSEGYGNDNFAFKVNDGEVDSNAATVTITINPVNDAPVVIIEYSNYDNIVVDETTYIEFYVYAWDVEDDDTICYTKDLPRGAEFDVLIFMWTPDYDQKGNYEIVFKAEDKHGAVGTETAVITVNNVNRPPVADDQSVVTDEDTPVEIALTASDPDGDTLSYEIIEQPSHGGVTDLTYIPNNDYYGEDRFTFKVNDGTVDSNTAIVTLTINPVNDPPKAVSDSIETSENEPVDIDVLDNDSDVDSEIITIVSVTSPKHGDAEIIGEGIRYTPDTDWSGEDTFIYNISDNDGGSASAAITVTVNPVTILDDSSSTSENTSTPDTKNEEAIKNNDYENPTNTETNEGNTQTQEIEGTVSPPSSLPIIIFATDKAPAEEEKEGDDVETGKEEPGGEAIKEETESTEKTDVVKKEEKNENTESETKDNNNTYEEQWKQNKVKNHNEQSRGFPNSITESTQPGIPEFNSITEKERENSKKEDKKINKVKEAIRENTKREKKSLLERIWGIFLKLFLNMVGVIAYLGFSTIKHLYR